MSSLIINQLEKIDKLITNGKYNNAMEFLEEILSKDISEKEKVAYNSYKIRIFNFLGKYQKALNLVVEILNYFNKHKLSIIKINVLIQKGFALAYLRKKEEVKTVIKEIEGNLSQLDNIPSRDKSKIKASIFSLKLFITPSRVKTKKYLEYALNYKKFAEKSKDNKLINDSLIELALAYYRVNEKDKSLDLIREAYKQATLIGYIKGQENSLWSLSYFESNREKSLEYAEKAIALHEMTDSRHRSYGYYVYLGCTYVQNCDFEKALISLHKAEKLLEEDDEERYSIYFVYARLFNLKGEFNLAYENIRRAQEIAKESNKKTIVAQSYYDLTLLALELEKPNLAETHLEELKHINKELDDEEINQMHMLASALTLKANKGIRDWSKAVAILEELIENEALSTSMFIGATLNLCELLIREIEFTCDVNLLDNIQTHLTQLQNIAENQKIYWLLIEILRLKSQIALLIYDINKAKELLEAALRVSQDKRIEKLTIEIINEQLEIEEKLTIWGKLQEIGAPLIETLKHVHLLKNIIEINQKTATVKTCSGNKNTIEYRKLFTLKI